MEPPCDSLPIRWYLSPLGGTVHTLRAGTHLFLHVSPQHPATGLAHSKGTVKIYERDGGKVPVFGLSLGERGVSDRMPVSQVRETEQREARGN